MFAFDAHYKLAPRFMQVIQSGNLISLPSFNVPNCIWENVNEGEENVQFKAFHCSVLRCPGIGMCADLVTCAPKLCPNINGVYRFHSAWRARETKIVLLAMRSHEKKTRARRFETRHYTGLFKVIQRTYDANVAYRTTMVSDRHSAAQRERSSRESL